MLAAIFWAVKYMEPSKNKCPVWAINGVEHSENERTAIFRAVNFAKPLKNKCARHFLDCK